MSQVTTFSGARPVRGRTREPGPRQPRYLLTVLLCFLVATLAFVGSTMYSVTRLGAVAQRSHEVSENAMPSVVQLGLMRRELAYVHFILDESAEGTIDDLPELEGHMDAFVRAETTYEPLVRFPREVAEWEVAKPRIARVQELAGDIRPLVERRKFHVADARVTNELVPAMRLADESLARLVAINDDEGRRLASAADEALANTRRLSMTLDAISILLTGALALAAFGSLRRHSHLVKKRTDELEAFALRVAHDIRGPLTPALLTLQTIAKESDSDGARHQAAAERGVRSLQRVDALVRDLLAFARGSAEPVAGARAPLQATVAGAAQDMEIQATAADVHVVVEDLPTCDLSCAPGVLTSVLENLLSNAIKHMPPDVPVRRVTVRATVRRDRARVEVADTGAGVAGDLQARVFQPYVRLDPSKPGLGLGLATVRRLVEAHAGAVGVRSAKGQGAVFWFELPVAR